MLIFPLSLFSLVAASVASSVQRSEVPILFNKHKRISTSLANATNFIRDDPAELQKRDGTKYVFMHHVSSTFTAARSLLMHERDSLDCWK